MYQELESIGLEEYPKDEEIAHQMDDYLKEKYLANTKSEVEDYAIETTKKGKILRYTITYNLYSAIVRHRHIYYENEKGTSHLEYYDVEEEGHVESFNKYVENVVIKE